MSTSTSVPPSSSSTIHASASSRTIFKVDRFFSNRLEDILIEMLQNARRANATHVEVTTETANPGPGQTGTRITFADDGEGISDFGKLLEFGESKWNEHTTAKEDPAGMGFFSLVHSGVTVTSRGKRAAIPKAAFLGAQPVELLDVETPSTGTVLVFERPENPSIVGEALRRSVRFGPLDVTLNGEAVPREDFLAGALMTKEVLGVRIGVYDRSLKYAWNFHGLVLEKDNLPYLGRVTMDANGRRGHLYARVDIRDAQNIHLKFPDRTVVVEDEKFATLCQEAKITLYEYLATLPEHTASFLQFEEAHALGVKLKEASPWFHTFLQRPSWEGTDSEFFDKRRTVLADARSHAIVDPEDEGIEWLGFTFQAALEYFLKLPFEVLEDSSEYEGYSWYAGIPRLRAFHLSVDGSDPKADNKVYETVTVSESIQLSFVIDRKGNQEAVSWELPFAGFKDTDWSDEPFMFLTKSSPWAAPGAKSEPFELLDAAVYAGFSPNEDYESDSSDTQLDYFMDKIHSEIIRALGGRLAQTRHLLHEALFGWKSNVSSLLKEPNLREIHLKRSESGEWESELITREAA